MKRIFLLLPLLLGGLSASSKAEPTADQQLVAPATELKPVVHLVISHYRGNAMHGSTSSVAVQVSSMDQCQEQGAKIESENTKHVNTVFWCVEGVN